MGAAFALFFVAWLSWGDDGRVLAKGPANPGHGGLECADCHDPAPGTVRQQVQAAVAFGLGLRETPPAVGRLPVSNQVCMDCHERRADLHPTHDFEEPKYFEERREIAADQCITCHKEHSGRHVANTGQFCSTCHGDVGEIDKPIQPTHPELVAGERWDTCMRCHDYHGNHVREAPRTLGEAFDGRTVLRHLDSGAPLYGEKRELASQERRR